MRKRKIRAVISSVSLFMIALLMPYAYSNWYDAYDMITVLNIHAILWISMSGTIPPIIFLPFGLISNWWILLLRLAIVYQVYRYYHGRASRESVILAGLLSESPGIFLIPITLFSAGPIPILFIAGIIIVFLLPSPEPVAPFLEEEAKKWWEEDETVGTASE
jgi:hypothetical protein